MKYNFINDVENSQMRLTITLPWRERVHHERKKIKWADVRKLVEEQYTPPDSHDLGECIEKYKIIDNNYPDALEATWEFQLLPKRKKTTRACEMEKKVVRTSSSTIKTEVKSTRKKTRKPSTRSTRKK